MREALFAAGSAGFLAKQILLAAGAKQNRPAVRRPEREGVVAGKKGEPAGDTALDFQQPEIGAAGRVTRDRGAAAVRRKTERAILARYSYLPHQLSRAVHPTEAARSVGGAVQQHPARGSSSV